MDNGRPEKCAHCGETNFNHWKWWKDKRLIDNGRWRPKCKIIVYGKTYRTKNKDKIRSSYKKNYKKYLVGIRKRLYGITQEQFEAMLEEQNFKCFLCVKAPADCVDHKHSDGKIRRLLCRKCNLFAGEVESNIEFTRKVLEYVTAW